MARPRDSAGISSRNRYQGSREDAFGAHQPLAHRPVGGLAEIPALGVLFVAPSGDQGDFHIGDGGASEHPQVGFLLQMG